MNNTQDEIVDIVNKKDEVVSQQTKNLAHQQGLLHRTIIAELINSKGEWCLVKQAADRQDPGQFVSPVGGHIRAGESEVEALIRESQEEVGVMPTKYKCIGKAIYDRHVNGKHENHYFIVYEIYEDRNPKLNHESIEYEWFQLDRLKNEMRTNPKKFGIPFHFVFNNFYKNRS